MGSLLDIGTNIWCCYYFRIYVHCFSYHILLNSARADAFISNEYDDSDRAWMDVARSSPLEVTIGPYEVYGDTLFGYKV